MSQFDSNQNSRYVENLRVFLGLRKRDFQELAGLRPNAPGRLGRLPEYPEAALTALEDRVNAKASRCEANDTTLGERYRLARDYLGVSDSAVAREFGVSRELVRRWGIGLNNPTDVPRLANLLNVPVNWLEHGGEQNLEENSHLGVRVGQAACEFREALYGLTTSAFADLPDDADQPQMQAILEQAVMTDPAMAKLARRAGGRWQVVQGRLYFAPWVPFHLKDLSRRCWDDEVEEMINEELMTKHSVYAAWHSLRNRCEAKGLKYPKMISLHKRLEKKRARIQKFGIQFFMPYVTMVS